MNKLTPLRTILRRLTYKYNILYKLGKYRLDNMRLIICFNNKDHIKPFIEYLQKNENEYNYILGDDFNGLFKKQQVLIIKGNYNALTNILLYFLMCE